MVTPPSPRWGPSSSRPAPNRTASACASPTSAGSGVAASPTLDVAVLERRDSTFEVLGIDGTDPLGGRISTTCSSGTSSTNVRKNRHRGTPPLCGEGATAEVEDGERLPGQNPGKGSQR